MARRYKRRIDWNWLRSITETSLNDCGRFPGTVNVDGKMEWVESGLYHDNYRFRIAMKHPIDGRLPLLIGSLPKSVTRPVIWPL
jgi:hypothetical protein